MDGTLQKLSQSLDDLIRKPSKANRGGAGGRGSAARAQSAGRGVFSSDPGRGIAAGAGQLATQAAVGTTQPRKQSARPDLRQPARSQQQIWQQPAKKRPASDVASAADIPLEKKLNLSLDELAKTAAAKRAAAVADAGQGQPQAAGRGGAGRGQAARGARAAAGRGYLPRAGRSSTLRAPQSDISMHGKYQLINAPSAAPSNRGRGRGGGRAGRMPGRGGYGSTTRYTSVGGASHAPIHHPYGLQDGQYEQYGEDEYGEVDAEYYDDEYDGQDDEYDDAAVEPDFGGDGNKQDIGAGYDTNQHGYVYKQGAGAATAAADVAGGSGEGYGPQRHSQPGLPGDPMQPPAGSYPARKHASYYSPFSVPEVVAGSASSAASFFRSRMGQLLRSVRDATGRLPLPPQFLPSSTPRSKKRPSADSKEGKAREDAWRKAEELRLTAESARAVATERAAGVARAQEVLLRLQQARLELGGSEEAQAVDKTSGDHTAQRQQTGLRRGGQPQRSESAKGGTGGRGPTATAGRTRAGHEGHDNAAEGEAMRTPPRNRVPSGTAPGLATHPPHPHPYANSHPTNPHAHSHPSAQPRTASQQPPPHQGSGWTAADTLPPTQDSMGSKPAAHSMQGETRGARRDRTAAEGAAAPLARPSPQTWPVPTSEGPAAHERPREQRGRSPTRERYSRSPNGAHRERGAAGLPVSQSRERYRARSASRGRRHWDERRVGSSRSRSRSRSRSPGLPQPPLAASSGERHPHYRYHPAASLHPQDAFEGRDVRHSRMGYSPEREWRPSGSEGLAPRRGGGGGGWGPSQMDGGAPPPLHPYDWPAQTSLHPSQDPGDYHPSRPRPHPHPGAGPAGGSFHNPTGSGGPSAPATYAYRSPQKSWQPGPGSYPHPPLGAMATAPEQPPPDRERFEHSGLSRLPERRDPGDYRGLSPDSRYLANRGTGREHDLGPGNRSRYREQPQMDRDREREREREVERERRERERERERVLAREREAEREAELARQRERERERDLARQRERETCRERERDRHYADREQRSSRGPPREGVRRHDRPEVLQPSRRDDVRGRGDDVRDEASRRHPVDGGRRGTPERDSTDRVTGGGGGCIRGQDHRLPPSRRTHSPDRSRGRNDSENRRVADREQQQQQPNGGGGGGGAGTAGGRGRQEGVVRERSRSPQASVHRGGGGEREVGSTVCAAGAGSGVGGGAVNTEAAEAATWNDGVYVDDLSGGGGGAGREEEEDAVRRGHNDLGDSDKQQQQEEEEEEGQAAVVSEVHQEADVYEEEIVDYDLPDELDID